MSEARRFVRRPVRIDDPELSPEANRVLTTELREALGTDEVELPAEQAAGSERLPPRPEGTLRSVIAENRLLVGWTFLVLVLVAVVVSIATDSWWALVVGCGVHAAATVVVASFALRLTTEVEHMDPSSAETLREEGVGDPDQTLGDLVERFGAPGRDADTAEVVSSGNNRVTRRSGDDAARATAEQRTAMTPSAGPSEPAGDGGMPMVIPLVAVFASVVVGLGAAIAVGGIAWVGAAVLIAAAIAWMLLERRIQGGRAEHDDASIGAPRGSRLLPTVAIVVAAVVAGVIMLGAISGEL
jgi:hypothetical protein